MDLSDAWVVKIVSSEMSTAERARLYPAIFSTKNLRTIYVNKGQAGKTPSGQDSPLRYQVIFGIYQTHGDEGAARGFPLVLANAITRAHGNHDVGAGLLCEKQTMDYDFTTAAAKAETTRHELNSRTSEAAEGKPQSTGRKTPSKNPIRKRKLDANSDAETPPSTLSKTKEKKNKGKIAKTSVTTEIISGRSSPSQTP